jgi:O-antigen/teichoic acid export membrane protein
MENNVQAVLQGLVACALWATFARLCELNVIATVTSTVAVGVVLWLIVWNRRRKLRRPLPPEALGRERRPFILPGRD